MNKLLVLVLNFVWAGLTWHLTLTPNLVIAPENLFNTILMMSGHFIFFGFQAVLLYFAIPKNSIYVIHYSIIITSLYGLVIELLQRSVPGRSADPLDWILDTLGAITFLFVLKKIQSTHDS